jgi:hypothetical protein
MLEIYYKNEKVALRPEPDPPLVLARGHGSGNYVKMTPLLVISNWEGFEYNEIPNQLKGKIHQHKKRLFKFKSVSLFSNRVGDSILTPGFEIWAASGFSDLGVIHVHMYNRTQFQNYEDTDKKF